MKSNLLLFILTLLFPLTLRGNAREYNFSNLSLDNGLSQITVNCIWQDKQGFMWFGTRSGLNRFNGYEFNTFTSEPGNKDSLTDNYITCITEDNDGNLWVGTNYGMTRLNLSTYTCEQFFVEENNPASLGHNSVSSVYYDETDNCVWIGTNTGICKYDCSRHVLERINIPGFKQFSAISIIRNQDNLYLGCNTHGLLLYNIKSKTIISYSQKSNEQYNVKGNNIRSIYIDSTGNLWIGTRHEGVGVLRKGESHFTYFNQNNGLTNNFVRAITESPEGKILVGTFNGLNVIDPNDFSIINYNNYDSNQGNLSHYSVLSIYFDNSGNLWIGTYGGGIDFSSPYEARFRFFDPNIEHNTVFGVIGPIVEHNDYLYIATEGGGLLEFDKKNGKTLQHNIFNVSTKGYGQNILKSLYPDGDRILCGTNVGTIYSFDIKSKKFSLLHNIKEEKTIYHISRSSKGEIIVGSVSQKGLCFIDDKQTMRNTFLVKGYDRDYSFPNIRCVTEIEKDVFLIGTRVNGVFKYDRNDNTVIQYKKEANNQTEEGLPENYITSILKDSNGQIWIGTFGGGLCLLDPATGKGTVYNTQEGLQNNNICAIVEDKNKHLWISTINGISDFCLQNRTFNNYSYANGIKIKEFSLHAGTVLSDNRIVFSGNNGFTMFNPAGMKLNSFIPPVALENLYVNNQLITPLTLSDNEENKPILNVRLNDQQGITLKHNQSNISIEYCALNYAFTHNNQYAYMLEGFDKSWNKVGNRRIAYYTNIPPGKYTFRVKGSNNDGFWNEDGASVPVRILPPLWKTGWAYSIYLLITLSLLWFIYRYYSEKRRLENDVKMKEVESKAQTEFHEARNRLFTNFSHELRTPLTLILSPLEDMISKDEYFDLRQKRTFLLMRENAHRLLRLVNNLMSFQKRESGIMELRVSRNNFVEFSHEMFLAFRELALSRNIRFNFNTDKEFIEMYFDKELMEKVYFNFLSNAFKNVSGEGSITVNLTQCNLSELKDIYALKASEFKDTTISYIYVEINDTGNGIPQEDLKKIFTPFFQVAQNEHASSGTGLGLSLSKSIIEMHHGTVWAESEPGIGARFKFILPVKKENFKNSEIVDTDISTSTFILPEQEDTESVCSPTSEKKQKQTILIVEDNRDVRNYIVSYLNNNYNTLEASNGRDALDKSFAHLPDLIITDLMMPKMDGLEMCSKLKSDLRTSHIPVIMITARTVISDILEGYEAGADDYITKPFHPSVLKARVHNILTARERLKEIYGKRFTLESIGVEVTSADELFMQKMYAVLEKNIANSELSQDILSNEIGMSKSNLYRKVKAITDLSPNELIRNYRLEMAAKMLTETEKPISEIYVAVGFNSLSYFSNCFKSQYRVSPSEYTRGKKVFEDEPTME